MIISRTPFRISFAGGGTDIRTFYQQDYGAVLSTTIDKHVYVTVKPQNRLHDYRIRVSYSRTETVESVDEIQHPIVRAALPHVGIDEPIEIVSMADIPAKTGLGSSSSFTVGLLHALYGFRGQYVTPDRLAREAARLEIEKLGRPIGKQDHYAVAFGGMNFIRFLPTEEVVVDPVICPRSTVGHLFTHLLLFYTGITRDAGAILRKQQARAEANVGLLRALREQAVGLKALLETGHDLADFGRLLHQGWLTKCRLTPGISNHTIDAYCARALEAGALGCKLLGAGGGGFILLYAEPARHAEVRGALADLAELTVGFEPQGSRIIFYDPP